MESEPRLAESRRFERIAKIWKSPLDKWGQNSCSVYQVWAKEKRPQQWTDRNNAIRLTIISQNFEFLLQSLHFSSPETL